MVGSFETSRNPWFAAPSADIHAFGEIRAYQNSPVHAGMNNPPRNSKVRRDLLAYLAANGITPPQHLSPAAPAPTPQRSSVAHDAQGRLVRADPHPRLGLWSEAKAAVDSDNLGRLLALVWSRAFEEHRSVAGA
eukprot:TRINITY_DN4567_c0_g1_i2.p2 TRINITY_DN4567_c0_g1~~TRINITY_DN4567_c0_g1_i2.p2  ORF type:complete len:134 (-),score=19.49 TRINITY_DN4567_c0_g1_i2:256-657(-)